MELSFISLASGSSGNCYYLGTSDYGILIDAGIGIRTIKKVLKDKSIDFSMIMGILVTHDHADHIKSVGYLGEQLFIPIYSTEKVHRGIDKSRYVEEKLIHSRRIIEKDVPFSIRDFTVTAFEVPHDSSDNVGYSIEYGEHMFVIITDVGHITDTIVKYVSKANSLVIEANYDEEMLQSGFYPPFLKERVAGPNGHLGNHETAEFLAKNYRPQLKNIWLCHLSKDNNHPELARKTITSHLRSFGILVGKDVHLDILRRRIPSEIFELK